MELLITSKNKPLETVTDVRSFELAVQTEILREGYLGETTDRRDEVMRGVRGRMELHFESGDVFDLIADVVNRAQRREPGTQINIKATLNYPSGERKRVLVQNAFFGELPIGFASRADYGTLSLDFEAEGFRVI